MHMTDNTTLLVIPYLAAGAQGGELETAVDGWRRNFDGNLRMVIIGDRDSVTARLERKGLAELMDCPRDPAHMKEPALDISAKMRRVSREFDGFFSGCIWSNDDIYPVNRVSPDDIRTLKIIGEHMGGRADSPNWFQRGLHRTGTALRAEGLPDRNYCAHLPGWYSFDRLDDLLDTFGCDTVPHIINSLYYNYYFPDAHEPRVNVSLPGNRWKLGLYSHCADMDAVRRAMEAGVLFVNNSPEGYSPELIRTVRNFINR